MWCTFCGQQLKNDAKFCPNCGKPIAQMIPKQQPPRPQYAGPPRQPQKPALTLLSDQVLPWLICGVLAIFFLVFILPDSIDSLSTPADDIQDTIWNSYSETVPLGEAFDEHFLDASWENRTYNDDPYVTFSGEIMTEYAHLDVTIVFRYQEQEETFYTKSATINGEPISDYGIEVLMQYGFDGDKEVLLQNLMADQILGAIFEGYW